MRFGTPRARHESIMNALIDNSEYPDIARDELAHMLGRSKAQVLKLTRPMIVLG